MRLDSRRPGYLLPRRATRLALGGVMLAMFLAVLNQTVVATALPVILADIGGVARYSWVFTAYMLGLCISMPAYGALSDRHGRRRFMLLGIALLGAGCVAAAAAGSMSQLILARAIQGLGAGAIIPLALTTVGDLVPAADRGRWQALIGATLGLATVGGPLLGGWAVDHLAWQWTFLASVPLAVVCFAVVAAAPGIAPNAYADRRIDYPGIGLLAGGLTCAMLLPFAAGVADALLAAGAVGALSAFAIHERRSPWALIPVALFRARVFTASHVAGFLLGASMFVPVVFVPLLLQGGRHETATRSAAAIIPMMLGTVLASAISGHLISRSGRYRRTLLAGPLLMGGGFALLAMVHRTTPPAVLIGGMALAGLGIGLLMHNLVLVVQNGIPSGLLGIGTSTTQLARQLGGVVGVGAAGALFDRRLEAELGSRGLPGASGLEIGQGQPGGPLADALAAAIQPVFLALLPIAVLTFVAVVSVPELPLGESVRRDAPEPRDLPA